MKEYQHYLEHIGEYGTVEQVRYPLAFVNGLPGAQLDEVVLFQTGCVGRVVGLHNDVVHVAMLSGHEVQPGDEATRTDEQLTIPVSASQRGSVLNPLGHVMVPGLASGETEERPIEVLPPRIGARAHVSQPFHTGASIVDLLVPLAAGQRECVLGDQKSGKTTFLLNVAAEHAQRGGIVVFAVIGRPLADVQRIAAFLHQEHLRNNTIVVATSAQDTPSLIVLTPFSAMTIAEYWRDQGHNVLLILHDLSTHARYYREVALQAGRFPGRESYPGDIFYLHARLLERAGNFTHAQAGEAALTCLPVAETVNNNLGSYIISNLIGITDGHLLFDSVRFSEGQRPAVDVAGSVSRVGLPVQTAALKELHRELLGLLNRYEQAQQYSKFGAELSDQLQRTLTLGTRLLAFLAQPGAINYAPAVQTVVAAILWQGWLNQHAVADAAIWRDNLMHNYTASPEAKAFVDELIAAPTLSDLVLALERSRQQLTELCTTSAVAS